MDHAFDRLRSERPVVGLPGQLRARGGHDVTVEAGNRAHVRPRDGGSVTVATVMRSAPRAAPHHRATTYEQSDPELKPSSAETNTESWAVVCAEDSWIWVPTRVVVIAAFAEAIAACTPAEAVEPRATFSSAAINCRARLASRLLWELTSPFSTACACAALRFIDPTGIFPPIFAITDAV